ncbi:LIRP-like isoform X1 [Bacillus rossius redtenbacheri]|uniref:LIRP-like isoform X1 n=1 Tax=Bacillus rossius redtenbacheri TaxID=93214 RepID=UPI002FDDA046
MFTTCVQVIVVLIVCISAIARTQPSAHQYGKRSQACGKDLANMLQLVCGSRYNNLFKKSPPEEPKAEEPYLLEPLPARNEPCYPFRVSSQARSVIPGAFRRLKRGLVDECCAKSCSIDEMRSYCAPP